MLYRKSISRRIFEIVNVLIMLIIAFLCAAPLLHVFFASISDPALVSTYQGLILRPLGNISLKGYQLVFENKSILSGYANTIFYVVTGTSLSIISSSIAAYAFSRKTFAFRNVLMLFISFTMLFNGGMVPTYMVIKNLGLLNTRAALIIPGALSVFNIIIMRTAFQSIPDSLEEAARIDGAKDMTILFRVLLPLTKATIAVLVLFSAVGIWNSWFGALLYLKDRNKYPLQMILREILIQNNTDSATSGASQGYGLDLYKQLVKYSTIMVATLPVLCIYPFVQKHFVTGVMIGSVKG